MPARDLKRILPDGTAWVDDGRGGEQAVQLVVGANNALGVRPIKSEQALGLDQVGEAQPLPDQPSAPAVPSKGHFDISGLDQG